MIIKCKYNMSTNIRWFISSFENKKKLYKQNRSMTIFEGSDKVPTFQKFIYLIKNMKEIQVKINNNDWHSFM